MATTSVCGVQTNIISVGAIATWFGAAVGGLSLLFWGLLSFCAGEIAQLAYPLQTRRHFGVIAWATAMGGNTRNPRYDQAHSGSYKGGRSRLFSCMHLRRQRNIP